MVNGSLDHTGLFEKDQGSDFSLKNSCALKEQNFLKFIKLGVSRLSCVVFSLPLLGRLLLSSYKDVCAPSCDQDGGRVTLPTGSPTWCPGGHAERLVLGSALCHKPQGFLVPSDHPGRKCEKAPCACLSSLLWKSSSTLGRAAPVHFLQGRGSEGCHALMHTRT